MYEDFEHLAPRFAGALFDLRVDGGTVWVSADLAAVAMWQSPNLEAGHSERAADTWARYRSAAGEEPYARLQRYNAGLSAVSPQERYWYLGVLATDPTRRRQGLASALLAPILEEADATATPCCLETSTPANRHFYCGHGFAEATPVPLADGPPTWWLRRPPPAD